MLKLLGFEAQNAGCISSAQIPLDNQGLTLVHGVNHDSGDSNGSGKSMLLDLLAYTLTGKTGRGGKKNDLLNLKHPKNYFTAAEFERLGNLYRVEHYRAHKEQGTCVKLFENGVNISPTTKLDDVQSLALRKLGFAANEFFGQIYMCQSYTHALVNGTPAEKRKYLSMYFGLDPLDEALTITKKRLNGVVIPNESELQELIDTARSQLAIIPDFDTLLAGCNEHEQDRDKYQARILELKLQESEQIKAKAVAEKATEIELALSKIGISFEVNFLRSWCNDASAEISELLTEYTAAKERDVLQKQLALHDVDTSLSYADIRKQITHLENKIPEYTEQVKALESRNKLEKQLAGTPVVTESLKTLAVTLRLKTVEVSRYAATVSTIKTELGKLASIDGAKCPTCLRDIDAHEHEALQEKRESDLKILSACISDLNSEIERLQIDVGHKEQAMVLESQISTLPQGDLAQTKATLESWVESRQSLQQLADALVEISSLQDRLQALPETRDTYEIKNILDKKKELYKEVNSYREWLLQNGAVKFEPEILALVVDELAGVEQRHKKAVETLFGLKEQKASRINLEKQIASVEAILAKNHREKQRRHVLEVMHLSLGKIKTTKLKQASDMLTSVLPFYISQMFPRGDVQIRAPESEDEWDLYLEKGGQQIPLFMVSGGQGKRVALAIFFAFAKIGAKNSNILILDEPMRDLDPLGRGAVMEIIQDLAIPSVFVTTHDIDLQDRSLYNQVWTMEMKNDLSVLVK